MIDQIREKHLLRVIDYWRNKARRKPNPKVELASGEFDRRSELIGKPISTRQIAQFFGISQRELINYRANYISRKKR